MESELEEIQRPPGVQDPLCPLQDSSSPAANLSWDPGAILNLGIINQLLALWLLPFGGVPLPSPKVIQE